MGEQNKISKKRIGNNIPCVWKITNLAQVLREDGDNTTLVITTPEGVLVPIDHEISGNVVSFTMLGRHNHVWGCGRYRASLVTNFNTDKQRIVDSRIFVCLVPNSEQADLGASDITEETIELVDDEVWFALKGDKGDGLTDEERQEFNNALAKANEAANNTNAAIRNANTAISNINQTKVEVTNKVNKLIESGNAEIDKSKDATARAIDATEKALDAAEKANVDISGIKEEVNNVKKAAVPKSVSSHGAEYGEVTTTIENNGSSAKTTVNGFWDDGAVTEIEQTKKAVSIKVKHVDMDGEQVYSNVEVDKDGVGFHDKDSYGFGVYGGNFQSAVKTFSFQTNNERGCVDLDTSEGGFAIRSDKPATLNGKPIVTTEQTGDLSALQTTAKGNLVEAINEAAASGGGCKVVNIADYFTGPYEGQPVPYDADVYTYKTEGVDVLNHKRFVTTEEDGNHLLVCLFSHSGGQGDLYLDFKLTEEGCIGEAAHFRDDVPEWILAALNDDLYNKVANVESEVGNLENLEFEATDIVDGLNKAYNHGGGGDGGVNILDYLPDLLPIPETELETPMPFGAKYYYAMMEGINLSAHSRMVTSLDDGQNGTYMVFCFEHIKDTPVGLFYVAFHANYSENCYDKVSIYSAFGNVPSWILQAFGEDMAVNVYSYINVGDRLPNDAEVYVCRINGHTYPVRSTITTHDGETYLINCMMHHAQGYAAYIVYKDVTTAWEVVETYQDGPNVPEWIKKAMGDNVQQDLTELGSEVSQVKTDVQSLADNQTTIADIERAMQNLPDGSAVSAQVSVNTGKISELGRKLEAQEEIEVGVPVYGAYVTSKNLWTGHKNTDDGKVASGFVISVIEGCKYSITANDETNTIYSMLSDNSVVAGSAPNFVSDTKSISIPAGMTEYIIIPSGCKYLQLNHKYDDNIYTPKNVSVLQDRLAILSKSITALADDVEKIGDVDEKLENTKDNIIGIKKNYVGGFRLLSGYGTPVADDRWLYTEDYIPFKAGDTGVWNPGLIQSNASLSFYDENKVYVANLTANAEERNFSTTNADVKYVRASFAISKKNEARLIINGEVSWVVQEYKEGAFDREFESIDKRLTALEEIGADIVSLNDEQLTKAYFQQMCKLQKSTSISRRDLVLAHFSDIHQNSKNLLRIMEYCNHYNDYINDVICSGDMLGNTYNQNDYNFWSECGADSVLTCIGNHDTAEFTTTYQWYDHVGEDAYMRFFSPFIDKWGVEHDGNTSHCYYYKDYLSENVRLVVLDSMDILKDGGANQLEWFNSTLESARIAGLDVVCVMHHSSSLRTIDSTFCSIRGGASEIELPSSLYNAVDSFIENGGSFVCWLCGHSHEDRVGTIVGHDMQMCIVIASANANSSFNTHNDVLRIANNRSYDLFNIVSVDTYNKTLSVMRVGANIDTHLRHIGTMCYSYASHKLLYND